MQPDGAVGAGETALLGEAETAIEGDPEHDFGVDEVLFFVAHFPDGHVGLVDDGEDEIFVQKS